MIHSKKQNHEYVCVYVVFKIKRLFFVYLEFFPIFDLFEMILNEQINNQP